MHILARIKVSLLLTVILDILQISYYEVSTGSHVSFVGSTPRRVVSTDSAALRVHSVPRIHVVLSHILVLRVPSSVC